jgi:AraC-like DNA-binding protein
MEMAKSQIFNTDRSIAEIGMDIGFTYPTHFSAAFKKHFGYLPTHLRRTK